MTRIILFYGVLAGLIIAVFSMALFYSGASNHHSSVVVGYLVMLVGMSMVLVGVRQYRNDTLGGVIRFWPALGIGLAIALVAGVFYVAGWELYLAVTHYKFADDFSGSYLAAQKGKVSAVEYAKLVTQMEEFKANYANPLYRYMMTFTEIAPVVVIVPLLSAALLRNPKFLPARVRA